MIGGDEMKAVATGSPAAGAGTGASAGTARFGGVLGAHPSSHQGGNASPMPSRGGAVLRTVTAPISAPAGPSVDALSQLRDVLNDLRLVLNGIAELVLPGGGAADLSRASTDPGQPLRRLLPSAYADARSAPTGGDRPGARAISNAVSATTGDRGNAAGASDMFWLWGQFLDHDIDLVHTGDTVMHIPVPEGDAAFEPGSTLEVKRSLSADNMFGAAQQINAITALIDASNVYGSDAETTDSLRTMEGGRLMTSGEGGLLPVGERGFYRAGDERANENIGLTAMHTLFVREHNRLADRIAADNPCWSDGQIFDAARARVTAQLQSITVNEFLPILFGGDGLGPYAGPVAGLDAQASNAFAAAAYRFGHSMVSDTITPIGADGQAQEALALREAFFNPAQFGETGIDAILRGFASQEAQAMDTEIVDSLRNFVMDGPRSPRLDLAALNIERGRDHGLPTLNDARRAFGFAPITSFDDPAFRDGAGARLATVYESPEQIDLWVGLLSERPAGEGLVGPTQETILRDQFTRLRDGDPDWYANTMSGAEIAAVEGTTLADIIERNTAVAGLSDTAMVVPA